MKWVLAAVVALLSVGNSFAQADNVEVNDDDPVVHAMGTLWCADEYLQKPAHVVRKINNKKEKVSSSDGFDEAMAALKNACVPPSAPQDFWEQKFERAKSQKDKMTLLQTAWANAFDPNSTDAQRAAWYETWMKGYQYEAQVASMPNPYAH